MSKTLALLMATTLAATSAVPALAGGLDDAIIEAPIDVAPPPPAGLGLGGLGTAGAVVGGLVALGIIAAVVDDDDDEDDATPDTPDT